MDAVLLDRLMPEPRFGEVHSILTPATPGEMPLVCLLFVVRSLPALVEGEGGLPAKKDGPLLERMLGFGFLRLAENPGREMVFGGVGRTFGPRGRVAARRPTSGTWGSSSPSGSRATLRWRKTFSPCRTGASRGSSRRRAC